MDDSSQWEPFQDYPSAFPPDSFNLFGEPGLNFDLLQTSCLDLEDLAAQSLDPGHQFPNLDFKSNHVEARQDGTELYFTPPVFELKGRTPEITHSKLSEDRQASSTTPYNNAHQKRTRGQRFHGDEHANTKKAKWESSVVVFGVLPGSKVALRKRKRFGTSRRQEVAINRLVGACIQCKVSKASVRVTPTHFVDGMLIGNSFSVPLDFLASTVFNVLAASLLVKNSALGRVL